MYVECMIVYDDVYGKVGEMIMDVCVEVVMNVD